MALHIMLVWPKCTLKNEVGSSKLLCLETLFKNKHPEIFIGGMNGRRGKKL